MSHPTNTTNRQAISDKELKQALETCAQEPIHIPGSIQPQGYMMVLNEDFTIAKASANCTDLFGGAIHDILKRPLSDYLDEKTLTELASLTSEGALNPIRSTALTLNDKNFDAIIHKSGNYRILEIEPLKDGACTLENNDFYREVMGFSIYLQKVKNPAILYDYVVNEIRRITGFARVKLYQFNESWDGTVIAESKEAHMPSYLGLSFPHSDIPKQARILFSKNYLRLIPDVHYMPVALLPDDKDETGKPVDMSFSVIRSVSPVHVEYLKNMDVGASMSISIMQNDQLWGLIACHHDKPYQVPYTVRMAAELFGHTFSAFLSSLKQHEELSEERSKESLMRELNGLLTRDTNLMSVLKKNHSLILDAVNADGVIIYLDSKYFAFGLIPEMSFCHKLIAWLEDNCDERIFASNAIGRDTTLAVQGQSFASGVLAVPVSPNMTDYVMWFREEQASHVTWAGKPEKHITEDETGFHLTPRASFNRWQENIRGFSKPWSPADIDIASSIGKLLLTKRYEDSLRQKNENLDSILNNSSAVIYIIDTEDRIISMNESAQKAFALDHQDIIDKPYTDVFDDTLRSLTKEQTTEVIQQQASKTFEQSFSYHERSYHFISVNFPLYNSAGDIYAVCVISTDISAIKQTEEKLIQSNKELERMAYITSHDLQEPLRMIASFTDLINRKHGEEFDTDSQKYMKFTFDATLRMKNLISDLLQYSRLTVEDTAVTLMDTQKECAELLDTFSLMYKEKNAIIHVDDNLPSIYMLPRHFSCLIENLIGNGIKYSDEGCRPEIHISCADTPAYWEFSVKDNGIGIDAEHFDKIFVIFQRLHRNTAYEGTGIGLALCKRIIDNYGGKIWPDSVKGQGSVFTFTIPKHVSYKKTQAA